MKRCTGSLVVCGILIVWLAATIVRIENERYALVTGMCRDKVSGMADATCLAQPQSRTSWTWHLWYALRPG